MTFLLALGGHVFHRLLQGLLCWAAVGAITSGLAIILARAPAGTAAFLGYAVGGPVALVYWCATFSSQALRGD